jgi:copper(I)-binding protein
MRIRLGLVAALLIVGCGGALAADTTIGALKIVQPWVRETPKGAKVGGGYLTITNTGSTPDRLVGGATPAAGRFEIHTMSMDNGVMKMRQMESGIEIKPGETVELKPGGLHVMMMDLKQPFAKGGEIKSTLKFEKAGSVDVVFPVQAMGAAPPGKGHAGH